MGGLGGSDEVLERIGVEVLEVVGVPDTNAEQLPQQTGVAVEVSYACGVGGTGDPSST